MTLRLASLLSLAVVLGLIGCRDPLVDEPLPPGGQEPPTDSTTHSEIYLKGPTELQIGETRNYRAEPLAGVVAYRWSLAGGTGQVAGVTSDPHFRVYDITGVTAGTVLLSVRAIGEHNEILGVASKTVRVFQ